MKQEDPEIWRAKVRSCRISEGPADMGHACLTDRRQAISSLASSLAQAAGVQEEVSIMWMTKPQFVEWFVCTEGKTPSEASVLCASKLASSTTLKRGQGDAVRVGVEDIPRTTAYRSREVSKTVVHKHGLESASQAEDAMAAVASHGGGPRRFSASTFGSLAAPFAEGSGASSSCVLNRAPEPAPRKTVMEASGDPAPTKRSLAASISEPVDPARSKTARRANAGVTGELLLLRQKSQTRASRSSPSREGQG